MLPRIDGAGGAAVDSLTAIRSKLVSEPGAHLLGIGKHGPTRETATHAPYSSSSGERACPIENRNRPGHAKHVSLGRILCLRARLFPIANLLLRS